MLFPKTGKTQPKNLVGSRTVHPPIEISEKRTRTFFSIATRSFGNHFWFCGQPSSWFNFSYVYRLWRNVALAVPGIWCLTPLHRQQWATAMLERSKSAELVLDLNFSVVPLQRGQFMKDVLENHTSESRIRELSLRGLSSSILSALLHDIQLFFRLRSLKLVFHSNCTHQLSQRTQKVCWILDVVRCGIAWFSMPLTGLTSLKMVSKPTRLLWSEFIEALKAMSSLGTLEIHSLPLANQLCRITSNPFDDWTSVR